MRGNRGTQNRLYENNGNGTFFDVTAQRLPPDADDTRALALADFDEDGDLDLLVGNAAPPHRFYRNLGGGIFADEPSALAPFAEQILSFGVADLDRDGDLDVIAGALGYTDRVWVNLTRQIHVPSQPILGGELELHAWAQTSGAGPALVVPFASPALATAPLPLPPHGLWRLDLMSLTGLPVLSVASTSTPASLSIPVPRIPSLIGRPVYFQAAVFHGPSAAELRFSPTTMEIIPR